jgi:hypothetical protein
MGFSTIQSPGTANDDSETAPINDMVTISGGDPAVTRSWKPSDEATIHGTPEEVKIIRNLIDFEFANVFDYENSHVGAITERTGVFHYIDTGDAKPVARPPYRMSPKERELTDEWLEQNLQTGAISRAPAGTEWAAPCLWVPKPGGGQRFCQDYRGLNAATKKDKTRPPEIVDIIDKMAFRDRFSKMDWCASFTPVKDWFITHRGLYVANVLGFGPTNGPAT